MDSSRAIDPPLGGEPVPTPAAATTSRGPELVAWVIGGSLTAGVVALLLLRPARAPLWDQTFIGYQFSHGYPALEEGIVAHLLVGLINALVPYEAVTSNALIRAVAGALFVGSAGLLAWSVTGRERLWGFVAFMLLIVTSRFAFLWLSSELFAAAFLMLFLWSLWRGHSIWISGVFLTLFAFTKADLALPGMLVAGYLALRRDPAPRRKRAAILGGYAAVVLLPAVLFSTSYYARFGGRAWVSFGQHYGELARGHQLEAAPSGWARGRLYRQTTFPGTSSVVEVARKHTRLYLHFVAMSAAESAYRAYKSGLLLLSAVAAYFFARLHRSWKTIVLLLLTNLIPIITISFMHMRYQARFHPLVLFVIFAGLSQGAFGKRHELVLATFLAGMIVWQFMHMGNVLATAHWQPD